MNCRIMKIYEVQQTYLILSQAKLDGLTTEEKYKVITAARSFKDKAKEFEDFIKDTQEKVTDEKEQNEILQKEAAKDIEINAEKVGKETFDKLIDKNPWNVAQIMMLEDNVK